MWACPARNAEYAHVKSLLANRGEAHRTSRSGANITPSDDKRRLGLSDTTVSEKRPRLETRQRIVEQSHEVTSRML
jgi:hypothetical protein